MATDHLPPGDGERAALTLATPANDNWGVCSDWQTPAEALQAIRRMKAALERKLAADFTLRQSPEYRQDWEIVVAMEKCALWHHYGVRA